MCPSKWDQRKTELLRTPEGALGYLESTVEIAVDTLRGGGSPIAVEQMLTRALHSIEEAQGRRYPDVEERETDEGHSG